MAVTPAKENILRKIRQALVNPVPQPFPHSEGAQSVFKPNTEDATIVFAEEFTKLQGKFAFCNDETDLKNQLQQLFAQRNWSKIYFRENKIAELLNIASWNDLASCDASITGCEYLVARTGTIVMSAAQQSGRTTSVYAPVHICIAYSSQVLFDLKEALSFLKQKYSGNIPSLITFASGPSRTADIEKTLVTGVHGPKEVYCFLIEG
ncbi:MAG: LUD domain-containing protein [Bacteroidetes bacterium]|nr:LUD domain-containing protein [Bacteroidota bacterium]